MKSTSQGTRELPHQVGHEEDRALEHADQQERRGRRSPRRSRGRARAMRACERVLVDEDLGRRPARARSGSRSLRASRPATSTSPGIGDDLVAAHDERPRLPLGARDLRVDEHVLHLPPPPREPIARAPALARAGRAAATRSSTRPSGRRPRAASGRARARAGRTRVRPGRRRRGRPASTRHGDGEQRQGVARRAGEPSLARVGRRRRFSSAAGWSAAQQRQDLGRGSGRASCPGWTSPRGTRGPRRGSRPRSPRARRRAAGGRRRRRAAARSRFACAARDEPVEHGLDLVRRGVAGRPQAAARGEPVAQRRAAPPRCRGRPCASTHLGAEHLAAEARVLVRLGAAQAVVDVDRGHRVAERAERRARGRSSRRRPRRGRSPRRRAGSGRARGRAPRSAPAAPPCPPGNSAVSLAVVEA